MSEEKWESQALFQMIALATGGASGKNIYLSEETDWQSVMRYAQEHGVLPLVGCALLHEPDTPCPRQLRETVMNLVRGESGVNLVRRQRIMQLLAKMQSLGLDVQVIKGYAVADCYRYPESRGSTDVDIYVPENQEKQVCNFLRDEGFRVTPRGKTEHHAVGLHPKLGKMEVHILLYNELITDAWFQGVSPAEMIMEAPVRVSRNGETYCTLGYTDHLIFLTLHMVKHFVQSGMSVRMMIDVAQFFASYRDRIDAARYWEILRQLRYDTVVRCVFQIMLDTGCYSQTDFPLISQDRPDGVHLLLQDLESGGNMGIKEKERIHNAYAYTRQVLLRSKSPRQYRRYMLRYKVRSAWHQMFPGREQLQVLYPILKCHKWLLPVLCMYRVFAYPLQKLREGVLGTQIPDEKSTLPPEAKRRMEMFKQLEMF